MDPSNRPTTQSNTTPQPSASDIAHSAQRDAGQPSVLAGPAAAQQPLDSRMDTDEDGDIAGLQNASNEDDVMPGLQDVSDSSDDDDEEDDDELHDVEMRPPSTSSFVSPSSLPSSSTRPESSTRTNGNRRARVEDDDDSERDRRHPSQRTSSRAAANNDQPMRNTLFRVHMMASSGEPIGPSIPLQGPMNAAADANPGNNNNNATASVPAADATPSPSPAAAGGNRPRQHTFLNIREPALGGMNGPGGGIFIGGLMSIPLRGMGNQDVPGGQPPASGAGGDTNNNSGLHNPAAPTTDNAIEEFLSSLGLTINQALGGAPGGGAIPININLGNFPFGLEEKDDPERAKKLVEGLEDVPVGLVKRLVRVGGTGGGMGEDDSKGGDAGCAICWDNLLDAEGEGFGKPEPAAASAADEANAESPSLKPETNQPRIVSLPCAHVFHADCLLPWFSRPKQTTCPTCRFNIDPDNLTYVSTARRERERRAAQTAARTANPDASAADATAPEANGNANPAVPEGNPQSPDLPANDPLPGLRIGQSIRMELVLGPLWSPMGQPGAPPLSTEANQPAQANQANNSETQPAAAAGDAQAAPENARDLLQRESERHLRSLMALSALFAGRPPPPGANAQGNDDEGIDEEAEGEDMHEGPPAERTHRASSAPPPSTAPLPRVSQLAQQSAAAAASPLPAQPGATSPRGTQLPPFIPNLFNNPTGPPMNPQFMAGTGRTLNEVLSQMFGNIFAPLAAGVNPLPVPGQPPAAQQGDAAAPVPAPVERGETAAASVPAATPIAAASTPVAATPAPPAQPNTAPNSTNASPVPNAPPLRFLPFPFFGEPVGQRPDPNRPKPAWTLPPAPGPTLRQRIERREREAGLRCYDTSCGIGPSDEEPELSHTISNMKQLSIKGADGAEVCAHQFHSACLVSAERVAMAAHNADLVCKDGNVEVSCPVCRGTGLVTEEQWNDGVATLG